MSRKWKSSVSLGPGAASLILIFVVLSMSVLAMLTLMNSRNDARLSDRSVQVAQAVYNLNVLAEEKRAAIDAALQNGDDVADLGVELKDDLYVWKESDGAREIDCAIAYAPENPERTQWVRHRLTAVVTEGEWGDD